MSDDTLRAIAAILPSFSDLRMRLETPIFWAVTKQLRFVPSCPEHDGERKAGA